MKSLEERLLRIEDAIIDLALDLEEGNICTAHKNAVYLLREVPKKVLQDPDHIKYPTKDESKKY